MSFVPIKKLSFCGNFVRPGFLGISSRFFGKNPQILLDNMRVRGYSVFEIILNRCFVQIKKVQKTKRF